MIASLRRTLTAGMLLLAGGAMAFAPPQMVLRNDSSEVTLMVPGRADSTLVAVSTKDGSEAREPIHLHERDVQALALSGVQPHVAEALGDGRLRVLDLQTGGEQDLLTRVKGVRALRLSPSATALAAATDDRVVLLDTRQGKSLAECSLVGEGLGAISLRNGVLLVGTAKGTLSFHRADNGALLREMKTSGRAAVTALDIESPNFAAAGYADGHVRIWDPQYGVELAQWRLRAGTAPTAVAFWPAAKWLAVASATRPVELFDAVGGTPLGAFPAETAGAMQLDAGLGGTIAALYPDGRLLVLDARSRSIKASYHAKLPAAAPVPGRP